MSYEEYDPADWWKGDGCEESNEVEVTLTEAEKKIAHYEERARCHWGWWQELNDKRYLHYYKQANIKIRKLKGGTRMFTKEKEMLEIVKDWLRPQVTAMETELYCGFAGEYVPDIVGITFDMKKVSQLKRQNPMPRSRIRKLLAENRIPPTYHTDLVAVELKLRNFVEAYFQAKMYTHYGFRAYIAMPHPVYFKLSTIRRTVLENDGIGFVEVGEKCKEILKARPATCFSLEDEIQIADRLICRFRGRPK